jgi:peptidyl-prolyl cis-trans isomerase D
MLDFLRRAVRSWVAQVLLGLLVVSFAVWGVGDIASGGSTRVAKVGEQSVSAETYAAVLRREQQRYALDPTQIRPTGLDQLVLARLVREAALDDVVAALGVSAPDEAVARQVRAEPAFQVAGAFDPQQYAAVIRRNFPSVAAYEETVRRSIASGAVIDLALGGVGAPPEMAETMIRWRDERRSFDALTIGAADLGAVVADPTDAELQAYLDANAVRFEAPERRTVAWAHIDPATLAGEIAEDDLRALYDTRRATYVQPETREIDQIVYADEAAAQSARSRLDAGAADFDALLAERGLSRADASLGAVAAADLPDARAEAAFALAAPGVAGPARTATGWALLDVRAIEPGGETAFDAVRDSLRDELAAERGRPEADRQAEAALDLLAGGATLEEIAAELGLTVATAEGVTREGQGVSGPPSFQSFRDAAFASAAGETLDPVRTQQGGYLLLRVDAVQDRLTPPLESIRELVALSWRDEATARALADKAEAFVARLAAGETLEALAAETGGWLSAIGPLRRIDPEPRLSDTARDALFSGPVGTAAVSAAGDGATIAVLRAILPPETPEAEAQALRDALAQSLAQDQLEYLGRALESRAGVSINPQTVEAVLSQIGA